MTNKTVWWNLVDGPITDSFSTFVNFRYVLINRVADIHLPTLPKLLVFFFVFFFLSTDFWRKINKRFQSFSACVHKHYHSIAVCLLKSLIFSITMEMQKARLRPILAMRSRRFGIAEEMSSNIWSMAWTWPLITRKFSHFLRCARRLSKLFELSQDYPVKFSWHISN